MITVFDNFFRRSSGSKVRERTTRLRRQLEQAERNCCKPKARNRRSNGSGKGTFVNDVTFFKWSDYVIWWDIISLSRLDYLVETN